MQKSAMYPCLQASNLWEAVEDLNANEHFFLCAGLVQVQFPCLPVTANRL